MIDLLAGSRTRVPIHYSLPSCGHPMYLVPFVVLARAEVDGLREAGSGRISTRVGRDLFDSAARP